MAMNFIFSAPFRTGINLNSFISMNFTSEVVASVTSSLNEVKELLPNGFSWDIPWAKDSKGELHYSELSEVKWSNPPGHLAKVVILPTEVKDDDREKTAEIHA